MLRFRRSESGSSFASCLLAFVVVFGGLGLYYFNYYQWHELEEPLADLVFVEDVSSTQLNNFRKKALASVCDAALLDIERLKILQKSTKKGTSKNDGFDQDCKELKNRLRDVMAEARLKRIPKRFEDRYSDALMGIHYNYKSLLALQAAVQADNKAQRVSFYRESMKFADKATQITSSSREYFHGDGWKE